METCPCSWNPDKTFIRRSVPLRLSTSSFLCSELLAIFPRLLPSWSGAADPPGQEAEVITLNGTFSPEGVHLHLSLSDELPGLGQSLGAGTVVLKGAVLLGMSGCRLQPAVPERVEVAVLPGCPWCHRATQLLNRLAIPYQLDTVDSDARFEAWRQRSGRSVFPQIFIDGDLIGGYDDLIRLHGPVP